MSKLPTTAIRWRHAPEHNRTNILPGLSQDKGLAYQKASLGISLFLRLGYTI